jgi:hypothetical protein
MTLFMLICACHTVRRWLEELGCVRMTRARILELSKRGD